MSRQRLCSTCTHHETLWCEPPCSICQNYESMPDWEDAVEAMKERCAAICDAHAAQLQSTADKYPAGTAACFAEEARELGRRMRGEK